MKLSTARIEQVLGQLAPRTVVVPETHPRAADLHKIFGNHTFFLDEDGLEIIEPAIPDEGETSQPEAGQLIKLAIWDDAARTVLAPHPAEVTGIVIHFKSRLQEKLDQAGEDSFPASDPTVHNGVIGREED